MSDKCQPLKGSVHFQPGRQKRVAFVFSCPGRYEEEARKPAAKTTGNNLDYLLEILGAELKMAGLCRANITITNAWPCVEYKGSRNGRTEASIRQVKEPRNLARLSRELRDVTDFVVFCGKRAQAAASLLRLRHRPRFAQIAHPGGKGLWTVKRDIAGVEIKAAAGPEKARIGEENTHKRLRVLAQCVVEQLRLDSGTAKRT